MGSANPDIALGYAMAYPLGVLGIIGTMVGNKISLQDKTRQGEL